MFRPRCAVVLLALVAACGSPDDPPAIDGGADAALADSSIADAAPDDASVDAAPDAAPDDASVDAAPDDASVDAAPDASPDASLPDAAPPTGAVIRLLAGNITSGSGQSYQPPGIRILEGLDPDIALLQELNVGDNSETALTAFVTSTFGADFHVHRETGRRIPNGIVSRYPILASGTWDQPGITDRSFVWARLDIPGDVDLWAVSVHLKADSGSRSRRLTEAVALVDQIEALVPAADYLVIGGDFNTFSRVAGPSPGEPCLAELSQVVRVAGPWPVDQRGDGDTNAGRDNPYDWLMFDADLTARAWPVDIGSDRHADGLVFDSRTYTPLSAVAPVQAGDSGVSGMQHMAVVRDIRLP